MISEFFLNIIFNIVESIFSLLPEITIPTGTTRSSVFSGLVNCVLYLLPIDTIVAIVGLLVMITTFRIIISILKTIWDVLPLV